VWCSEEVFNLIIQCEVDPSLRPPATDHFPIVTYIDLLQEHITSKASYNFQAMDWKDFQENLAIQMLKILPPQPLMTKQQFQQAAEDLMAVIQDMIHTRVPKNKPCSFSKRWWNNDLSQQKDALKKLSILTYKFRGFPDHVSHTELWKARNKYGEAIVEAKGQHWEEFLENMAEQDLWTANWYFKEPTGDGGKLCIPTLKIPGEGMDSLLQEVNTNDGKVKALVQAFSPKKPEISRVPEGYNYPKPLPPPLPITPEQITHQIKRLSPYKAVAQTRSLTSCCRNALSNC